MSARRSPRQFDRTCRTALRNAPVPRSGPALACTASRGVRAKCSASNGRTLEREVAGVAKLLRQTRPGRVELTAGDLLVVAEHEGQRLFLVGRSRCGGAGPVPARRCPGAGGASARGSSLRHGGRAVLAGRGDGAPVVGVAVVGVASSEPRSRSRGGRQPPVAAAVLAGAAVARVVDGGSSVVAAVSEPSEASDEASFPETVANSHTPPAISRINARNASSAACRFAAVPAGSTIPSRGATSSRRVTAERMSAGLSLPPAS